MRYGINNKYMYKPAGFFTPSYNRTYAQEREIQALWSPEREGGLGTVLHGNEFDVVSPHEAYVPGYGDTFLPTYGVRECGVVGKFSNTSGQKINNSRSLKSENQDILNVSASNSATMFAVASTTHTAAVNKALCGGANWRMEYNGNTNRLYWSETAPPVAQFSATVPWNANDGELHTFAVSVINNLIIFNIQLFFDGRRIGVGSKTTSMTTAGDDGTFYVASYPGGGQFFSWNGDIAMAGFSAHGWDAQQHMAFASAPFEVLYPQRRQRRLGQLIFDLHANTAVGPLFRADTSLSAMLSGDPIVESMMDADPSLRAQLYGNAIVDPSSKSGPGSPSLGRYNWKSGDVDVRPRFGGRLMISESTAPVTPGSGLTAPLKAEVSLRQMLGGTPKITPLMAASATIQPMMGADTHTQPMLHGDLGVH
jgi:hypothetical protein